jgi:hexosaminidase
MADAEYLAFPRLIGIAEIAWSPMRGRSWAEYRTRLGAQGPLLRRSASTTTVRRKCPGSNESVTSR